MRSSYLNFRVGSNRRIVTLAVSLLGILWLGISPVRAQQNGRVRDVSPPGDSTGNAQDNGQGNDPQLKRDNPAGAADSSSPPSSSANSTTSSKPPSIPVDEIIQKFAARESEFKIERDNFTYTQTYSIATLDDDGRVDGEYTMTSDIMFTRDGKRYEQVTYAPESTLERITLTSEDISDIKDVQPFVLTTEDLPKYTESYVGREQVDEIGTYVFDVGPKVLEKNQRYFQGRIWVDDRDFEIVKTYGKAVPDIRKGNNENVFPRFETYRENIEGTFWFPTYTHSDDILHFKTGNIHIRMTVHYSDYKRFRSTIRLLHSTPTEPTASPTR